MAADQIDTIRAVHQAALGLTLACTEFVGPVSMALGMPTASALGEPIPRPLRRAVARFDERQQQDATGKQVDESKARMAALESYHRERNAR